MVNFLKFIAIGSYFAIVEEFLTLVVLKHDIGSYVFTLLVVFPVFLTFVWSSSFLIDRAVRSEPVRELVHFFAYGFVGLLFEWFVMGLSPWGMWGKANPLVLLVFQAGMFSFWVTVAFGPRLLTGAHELSKKASKALLTFYVPYFLVVYQVSFLASEKWKFGTIVGLVLLGYLFLNVFYVRYFLASFAASAAVETSPRSVA